MKVKDLHIKGVMFDLDGTLLNTIGSIADAMNAVRQRNGLSTLSEEDYEKLVGQGSERLVKDVFPAGSDIPALLVEYAEQLDKECTGRTTLYPGMAQLLDEIEVRRLPMAIMTNKPEQTALIVCRHFLGKWPFDMIKGQVPGFPLKPDPAQALSIVAAWGISPACCLYLGDTKTDMLTAKNSGFFAVGVTWGFRDRAELDAYGADLIVDRPDQVITLLQGAAGG